MMKPSTLLLTLVTALISHSAAFADVAGAEQAVESTTSYLHLSDRLPHSISLAACTEGCKPVQLQITGESQFLSGRKALSFVEFRKLAAKAGLNATVFYEPGSKVITRVVVSE
jgi:hypothetical protein